LRPLSRRFVWSGFLALTLGLVLAICWWLSRAAPARAELRALRQLRALVYLIYPLATLAVPYLFRLLCPEETRRAPTWRGYLAVFWAPLVFGLCAAWVGGSGHAWHVALLLTGYGLLLAALSDLTRLFSAGVGQLIPSLCGLLMIGSVFIGARAVEQVQSEQSRSARIDLLVQLNPVIVACERIERFDTLRTTRVYGATPIGALYIYRFPDWSQILRYYVVFALLFWGAAAVLRYIVRARLDEEHDNA